ncbi:MAG: peptidoglycan D,D-transpeptidase FtsI family protein [Planctomycetota bacterium]|jgi:cell division protein FtsI (penicillin-binding protein 3)
MLQRSRILAVTTLLAIGFLFLGLGVSIFVIQVLKPGDYQRRADNYKFKPVTVPVPRGAIFDHRGELLAASIPAVDIWAFTKYLDKPWTRKNEGQETAEILAKLLDMDFKEIQAQLSRDGYHVVKRKIFDPDILIRLQELKQDRHLRGIDLLKTYCRYYPHEELMGHTLGFVNHEDRGVCGVEQLQDAWLQGQPGSRTFMRDGVQNEIYSPDEKLEQGVPGGDVYLTIDATVQFFAELELTRINHLYNPKWAAAVVMEPATGRILAAASLPSLDPTDPARTPEEGSESHWMNRVFKAEYTPGSTFKPLVMAMALQRDAIGLHEEFDCEGGAWRIRGRRVTDVHVNYRILEPAGILIKSSNIGMSKVALRLVPEDTPKGSEAFRPIRDTLSLLGFGKCPGIFPEHCESPGKVTPLEKWTRAYTLVSLSFGNEIAVTPVQMAAAFCALANGGMYVPPRLIDRLEAPDGSRINPPGAPAYRIFSEEVSRTVIEMLVRVVEEGSGKRCRIPGIQVAGKTGTAEKLPARTEVTSSFIAFAPADRPAMLTLVVVDEPQGKHYASQVAAPHVKAILEKSLSHFHVTAKRQACVERFEENLQ